MKKEDLKDIYPMSPLQEGLLFHTLFHQGDQTAYVEQFSYRIDGPFDADLFLQSWQELVQRHDILRTVFEYEKTKQPCQIVLKQIQADARFIDLCDLEGHAQQEKLENLRQSERETPFDPQTGKLARMCVVRLSPQRHEVLRTHHHILLDGWSSAILLQELMEIYSAKRQGKTPELAAPISARDYYRWMAARDRDETQKFWADYIKDTSAARLPFAPPTHTPSSYKPAKHLLEMDAPTTARLNACAQELKTTPAIVCRAIWGLLLSRYNDETDILFAGVATVRPPQVPAVEKMVGLFINAVAIRITLDDKLSFAQLVQNLQREALEMADHQYLPLSDILNDAQKPDHLFAFENFHVDDGFLQQMENNDYDFQVADVVRHEHTHYDFTIAITPGERLSVEFSYNQNRFETAQIQRIARHFKTTLHTVLEKPDIPVEEIDILDATERGLLLDGFNRTPHTHDSHLNLVERFQIQVANAPQAPAVKEGAHILTYRALDELSDQIAHTLHHLYDLQNGDHVAVLLPRSAHLVAGLLACLKLGVVYIPLDPDVPQDRLNYILKDSQAACVICNDQTHDSLSPDHTRLNLDHFDKTDICRFRVSNETDTLAYIIYTSGTTGQPKGVMGQQHGLINLCEWHHQHFDLDTASRATLYASPAFDASLWEILPNLLRGLCLYPLNGSVRLDTDHLIDFLDKNEISHCFLPPAICEEVSTHHNGRLGGKIKILTGGDRLKTTGAGDLDIHNNYGPTECSVVATSVQVSPPQETSDITIGRPIDNTQVYILDRNQRLLPAGCPGEVYLGGAGLAQGYWNQPGLNTQKFIPSPFKQGERLYRTGDLGLWDDQGRLVFLGRNDDQIQLRGYRVEPGEIETRLEEHPDITRAIVLQNSIGDLIAFYMAAPSLEEEELKADLRTKLPPYMVPHQLLVIDHLPLTARGKLDRKALLQQATQQTQNGHDTAPQTPTQEILHDIWCEVLQRETVSIDDHFFDIGGHSLSATRVMSRIRNKLALELPFESLFDHPSIRTLGDQIDQQIEKPNTQTVRPAITPSKRRRAVS